MRCRDIPRRSMAAGSGDGTRSRQEARPGLQPLTDYAGTSFTIGRPSLRKDVIDDVTRFDAERVLNDLGGLFAVVTVGGSFQQVTHLGTRTRHNRHQAPKIGPASRHDNLRFSWRMFILWGMPTSRTSASPASSRIAVSLTIILALHFGSRDVNLTAISPIAQED